MKLSQLKTITDSVSPGPWHIGHIGEDCANIDDQNGVTIATVYERQAESLICAMRTMIPKMIKVIEEANKLYEDIEIYYPGFEQAMKDLEQE